MTKYLLAASLVLMAGTAGLAQPQQLPQPTEAQRIACQVDYDKFCLGMIPGGGRIIACLDRHYDELRPACKKIVDDAKTKS
jgi:hypothetical protein